MKSQILKLLRALVIILPVCSYSCSNLRSSMASIVHYSDERDYIPKGSNSLFLINPADTANLGDESPLINKIEAKYLDAWFDLGNKNISLYNKKVLFYFTGHTTVSKKVYFDSEFVWCQQYNRTLGGCYLYLLNNNEKVKYNYDAIIIYWSKIHLSKQKVIDTLFGNVVQL